MKLFIALSAVILAASAMPTEVAKDLDIGQELKTDQEFGTYIPADIGTADATTLNSTARVPFGQMGFAAVGVGTHGGNGGSEWTVWDPWALRDALAGNNHRVIYVRGRIDLTALFTGSPGVSLDVGSHKTIIGGDRNAMIFGGGLRVRQVNQVIIDNIKFHNALSYAPGEQPNGNGGIISQVPGAWSTIDGIGIETAEHVWVNHCEFADDPWVSHNVPESQRRHDGLIDIVRGANWISISNNIFRNHNLVTLVGNDDNNQAQDRGRLKVTFYNNWYQGTNQRNPIVRFGEVHIVNNLYTDITDYAVGVWTGGSIFLENNVFRNTRRTWGFSGTPNPMGYILASNNLLYNSQPDANIPSHGVNWRPNQYYAYHLRSVHQIEDHVRRYAGVW